MFAIANTCVIGIRTHPSLIYIGIFLLLTGLPDAEAAFGLGLPPPEIPLGEKESFLKVSYWPLLSSRPTNRRRTGFW